MTKCIRSADDLAAFSHMVCYKELLSFIEQWSGASIGLPLDTLGEHVIPMPLSPATVGEEGEGNGEETTIEAMASTGSPPPAGRPLSARTTTLLGNVLFSLRHLLQELDSMVDAIPLQDQHAQRFGNKAVRDFHAQLGERVDALLAPVVEGTWAARGQQRQEYPEGGCSGAANEIKKEELSEALEAYLLDSFGNATRIDYGTGHELHFVLVLFVITKTIFGPLVVPRRALGTGGAPGLPTPSSPVASALAGFDRVFMPIPFLQSLTYYTFMQYLTFMRRLQSHYLLEPAGTHGVWGLDDYHHIPFILGAAQLRGYESEYPPKSIVEHRAVQECKDKFLYFSMIDWINTNKKGPFHEHSSLLFNISGVEGWEKTHSGMIKMYVGEVLSKRNIVQHLLFTGYFFSFERLSAYTAANALPVAPGGGIMGRHPAAGPDGAHHPTKRPPFLAQAGVVSEGLDARMPPPPPRQQQQQQQQPSSSSSSPHHEEGEVEEGRGNERQE